MVPVVIKLLHSIKKNDLTNINKLIQFLKITLTFSNTAFPCRMASNDSQHSATNICTKYA